MLRLDHVVFPVRNAAATLDFYRAVVGLPLVETYSGDNWGGYPWLMMIFGLSGQHELVCVALRGAPAPDDGALPQDVRHYALAAETLSELDEWRVRLKRTGVAFWEEAHGERSSIYFADPDGVILEVTYPPSAPREIEDAAALRSVLEWVGQAAPA